MSHQKYSDAELLDQLRRCKEEHGHCTPALFNEMEETASASLVMRRFGSWTEAKQQVGIDEDLAHLTGRSRKYTDEDVLRHIRECADRHDGKCTVTLMNQEEDLVAPSVAVERFGSWQEAKREAGVLPDERHANSRPREYSDDDYLALIRECKEKYGKATQRLFNDDEDFPSAAAVRKRFGSWSDAKIEAGIEETAHRYTDDELLEMLRTCKERHGSASASQFAADDEFCSPETLQRRFGSWEQAKEHAGVC